MRYAHFPVSAPNTVLFDGVMVGWPDYLKKFKSKFFVGNGISINHFDQDGDDQVLRYVEFQVDQLNATAVGAIKGIHTADIYFAGMFEGELIRKKNTNGCYLIPVVWNGRLLIFFPQIRKNTKTVTSGSGSTQGSFSRAVDYYEIKMSWSEYRNGKWTQKQVSADFINSAFIGGTVQIEYFKFVPVLLNDAVSILVDDRLDADGGYAGEFRFDGNSLSKGAGRGTGPMPINYFNRIETTNVETTSKLFSWQIVNNQRANTSIYFEDAASKELVRGVAPSSNFYHSYAHDLLGKINGEQLTSFFNYNLSIADKADAFGASGTKIYDELKRPYSLYNWELFFHVPFLIANELSAQQQFEEAMKWYHFIFDPTAPGADAKRFWKFLPFKEIDTANILDSFFTALQPNTPDEDITKWRNSPFQPHVIARARPSAYMKNVVMKYLDNLIAWGDYLFKQDTMETVNYATQLYVLARHIVRADSELIPKRGKIKPETYNSLLNKWDAFGNAMVELELVAPFSNQTPMPVAIPGSNGEVATANIFGFSSALYFCIPNNPKLTGYWDTIADRLFKIRHCENIDGVFRMLPLWDPPIDPALLVAATAQGLSLESVLNDLNTALPNYRFVYLLQKSIDLCNEVKSLGNSLLAVFEKKDGEMLSRMRAGHESHMHTMVMEVRKLQLQEANSALEGLQQNRMTATYRLRHYLQQLGEDLNKIPAEGTAFSELADTVGMTFAESGLKLMADEKEEMDKASIAQDWQLASSSIEALSGILHAIPDQLAFDFIGFIKEGGSHFGPAASAAGKVLQIVSSVYSYQSANAQRKAGFRRQLQERILQANLAGYECMQIDKQITSQRIRINMSDQEITNQQKMMDNSAEVEEFLKNKYTNAELYTWMEGQLKSMYKLVYDLAYEWARKAELVFRFDRGLTGAMIIKYGYWDPAYNGLQAGEKLFVGLKQLEAAYHENRGHDFEVTKHISLQQLDPIALMELRETGKCAFSIPETLFDMDFSGHYMRRIKTVSLSIPCIAGPYASVNATLRLQDHSYRVSSIASSADDYLKKTDENDDRFMTAHIPIAAIAASSGQHDSGVFDLNFKDERYMPFEGAGVISKWRLELPDFRQFRYESIADIIVHMSYTSKDGGDKLKAPATDALKRYMKNVEDLSQREGLFALLDIKNDFSNEWYKALLLPAGAGGRVLGMGIISERLPFYTRNAANGKVSATDIYVAVDKSFKISDLDVLSGKNSLAATMEGPEKIGDSLNLYHLSDLGLALNDATKSLSLKFADKTVEPEKMWMIVRYTLQ